VYGRTDMGTKGQHNFFKTHKCGELCFVLGRRRVRKPINSENPAGHVQDGKDP